ncbi:signal peptidase I [Alkaliphilus hydrothermalis]|uniref:Signal peptidase I n=1 Tax=Alkaliphilus hydrothermalis TaxID=1482730 RepID=A0ABS2NL52_9FIRM|nr:signal peptidase I [Alkaliphilus hydrothermalis]MBM7613646.1 signal peptidase I [Alkaliphilus hydrothermalis]
MSIGLAIVAALLINIFILELYTVQQTSMMPTFSDGDQVMAWKLNLFLKQEPNYGDIVIVDSNVERMRTLKDEIKETALINRIIGNQNKRTWIKRIVGKPGDYLEMKENKIYRNGELVAEDYILEEMRVSFSPITVPDNHYFVMGDNRNNSKDSRMIGAIPSENIRGKVVLRFIPFGKRRLFYNE